MKNKALFLLAFLIPFSVFGQVLDYEKFYGQESTNDYFNDIKSTQDGGYVAVGESQIEGKLGEFYFVKFDAAGDVEFERFYGTLGIETAYSIAILTDRYIIGGSTYIDGENNRDCYLLSVDFEGNLLNQISFGGSGDDIIYTLTALENDDIAVGATYEDVIETGADCLVRRYNSDLELLAETDYRGASADTPHFILEDSYTGNLLVGGRTNARGLLMHLSPYLDSVLWIIDSYGNTPFNSGIAYDENHFAVGKRAPGANESFIGLIDKNTGLFSETSLLPQITSNSYRILEMSKKDDQIYILADYLKPYFFQYDITEDTISQAFELPQFTAGFAVGGANGFAIAFQPLSDVNRIAQVRQFDAALNVVWESPVGDFANHSTLEGMQVIETESGELLLGGKVGRGNWRFTNIFIQKTDIEGEVIWESEFGPGYRNQFEGFVTTSDGGCLVAVSYSLENSGFVKLQFQKLNSDGTLGWFREIESLNIVSLQNGSLLKNTDGYYYFSAEASGQSILGGGTYVVKLDELGNIVWESQIAQENEFFFSNKMITTSDQNLMMAGFSYSLQGMVPSLSRMNTEGETLWTLMLDSTYLQSHFEGLAEDVQGNILAVTKDGKVIKFDQEGAIINPMVMEVQHEGSRIRDICIAGNGNFYLLDFADKFGTDTIHTIFNLSRRTCTQVHAFDSTYDFVGTRAFGIGRGTSADGILAHSLGGIAFFGTGRDGNNMKGQLVWLNGEGTNSAIDIQVQGVLSVFPTVFESDFHIDFRSPHQGELSIQISNSNGQLVRRILDEKRNELWQRRMNLATLPKGNYYITVMLNGYAWTKKMIKV